jgi:hypothetical protein
MGRDPEKPRQGHARAINKKTQPVGKRMLRHRVLGVLAYLYTQKFCAKHPVRIIVAPRRREIFFKKHLVNRKRRPYICIR